MIVALMLAMQLSASRDELPDVATYMNCVTQTAQRLLPSREAAEAIARAATFECQPKLSAAARAIDQASNAFLAAQGWPQAEPGKIHTASEIEPKIQAGAESAAVALVVEARLKVPLH